MAKVLIAEPLADAGVELLRTAHEVDARTAMTREELLAAIAGVDALVVRSASAWTTWTWPRPPGSGSWSSTRPSRTSSRPPSTPSP
jgi:hypothetical protein